MTWHDMTCITCVIGISLFIFTASEASSDTIFDNSRATLVPADGKNPLPADIIGSQTQMLWTGELANDG